MGQDSKKVYYINSDCVGKEKFVLELLDSITKQHPDNGLDFRNKTYREVARVVDEKSSMTGNFTISPEPMLSFHIIER